MVGGVTRRGDSLRRSWRLLQAFRLEQPEPEVFYAVMAADTVRMVGAHGTLAGKTVVDVGAGPRQYAEAFVHAGSRYVAVDHCADALDRLRHPLAHALIATGMQLPMASGSVDVAISCNVFEHVEEPERLADELVRITAPGGLIVLSYTNWLSPWGGHETSPFHYLGGDRAVRRYERVYGRPPKNLAGTTLHKTSVEQGLRWARGAREVDLVEARPRYYPRWTRGVLRVPGAREILTWNLWMVLRKR